MTRAIVLGVAMVQLALLVGAFSRQTNFMSPAGYARWRTFTETGRWR